jgi:hypothetical protein
MNIHNIAHVSALHLSTAIGYALSISDQAVIELIRSECAIAHAPSGGVWRDAGPLLDEREYSSTTVDKHRQALDYARLRGLIFQHPAQPQLVRLLRDE